MVDIDDMDRAAWNGLNAAGDEYAEAKQDFDSARVRFEVAKKRLAVTKEVAADVMNSAEWDDWLEGHDRVRYAGTQLGDAIVDILKRHAYQCLVVHHATAEKTVPLSMNLDQIVKALRAKGFEFRSLTPLREVNAALINLAGVEKDGASYGYLDWRDLQAEVVDLLADEERRARGEHG